VSGLGAVAIVTPWYPSAGAPYAGSFVREWLRALAAPPADVTVVHLEMVPPDDPRQPFETVTPEGRLLWVGVKAPDHLPRAEAARAQLAALTPPVRAAIGAAKTVFAHVTMPSGWAVSQAVGPAQRLVLVEHASYVPQVLGDAAARALFAAAVERAETVLAAGEGTAEQIRRALPEARRKVWAVGNPMDVEAFPFAAHPPSGQFRRWLYVGNLFPSKGVGAVVELLADHVRAGGEARLALAGQGWAEEDLRAQAARLGLAQRVDFLGGLDRAGVVSAMARADLMVHLSPAETFGLAPLEALVSGLPLLVAQNAGTSQTMTPALAAGRAWMVPPPAPSARWRRAAADGLAGLGEAVRAAGPAAAEAVRAAIAERYGLASFGQLQRRVARGQPPYRLPDAVRPPLAVAVRTRAAWDQAAEAMREALWQGRPVVAAVARGRLAAGADPRVVVTVVPDRAGLALAASRAAWLAGAMPLKAWALALRVARRLPPLRRPLLRWAAAASRAQGSFNRFNRARLDPAIRRAVGGRRAAQAWLRAAAAAVPAEAELAVFPADGPAVAAEAARRPS
jgi:glycogen(starch) synthase